MHITCACICTYSTIPLTYWHYITEELYHIYAHAITKLICLYCTCMHMHTHLHIEQFRCNNRNMLFSPSVTIFVTEERLHLVKCFLCCMTTEYNIVRVAAGTLGLCACHLLVRLLLVSNGAAYREYVREDGGARVYVGDRETGKGRYG